MPRLSEERKRQLREDWQKRIVAGDYPLRDPAGGHIILVTPDESLIAAFVAKGFTQARVDDAVDQGPPRLLDKDDD